MDEPRVGRELDAAVAEKVMRWYGDRTGYGWSWFDAEHKAVMSDWVTTREELSTILPHYSANIADAWQVVEYLRAKNYDFDLKCHAGKKCWCYVIGPPSTSGRCTEGYARADTAAEAICRAALMVAETERKEVKQE